MKSANHAPRPYQLGRRAVARDQRRLRIGTAAREELLSGRRFTLEAVAERAQVSRVTIYAQFGDSDALLEAVYDDLAASGGLLRIPEVFAASDPRAALDTLVGVFCHFYTVHRAVIRRLNALWAIGSAEVAGHHRDRDARRRDIIGVVLQRSGTADERLVDMLQALTSFAFVDELARRGRSPDDAAGQVSALVAAAVAGVELPRDAHEERT